jgi:hypothetical protein
MWGPRWSSHKCGPQLWSPKGFRPRFLSMGSPRSVVHQGAYPLAFPWGLPEVCRQVMSPCRAPRGVPPREVPQWRSKREPQIVVQMRSPKGGSPKGLPTRSVPKGCPHFGPPRGSLKRGSPGVPQEGLSNWGHPGAVHKCGPQGCSRKGSPNGPTKGGPPSAGNQGRFTNRVHQEVPKGWHQAGSTNESPPGVTK